MASDEQFALLPQPGVLGGGGETALIGGEVGLEFGDLLVALVRGRARAL